MGAGGKCYTKQEDLHIHRSRQQVLTKLCQEDLTVLVEGCTGVTWFLGTLEGAFVDTPFAAGWATPAPRSTTTIMAGVLWPPTQAWRDGYSANPARLTGAEST